MASTEEVRKTVLEVVAQMAGLPIEEIPLSTRLVRGLNLSYAQKSEILAVIEERLDAVTADGIHCRADFTMQDIIEFYSTIRHGRD